MQTFPDELRFKYTWRSYQARVLSEFEAHFEDRRFHLVAAPGSGKTVIGLELMRMLRSPTLIISPTLTIRNQWIRRLVDMFLPAGHDRPSWISTDVRNPGLVTTITYQALHSVCTGIVEEELEESGEEEDAYWWVEISSSEERIPEAPVEKVVEVLEEAGIQTIILDEAHHLRQEWWKTLVATITRLGNPSIIALTATPPFDVPPPEWDRYVELCGPIDIEIPVPELVKEGHLCPHQDYVHFSLPSKEEARQIRLFRSGVEHIVEELIRDTRFIEALENHPWILDPESNAQDILRNPSYLSSIAIILNHAGRKPPKTLLHILGVSKKRIPPMDFEWMEILLTGSLYGEASSYFETRYPLVEYEKRLKRIGAIERREAILRSTKAIRKLLASSISKLDGIVDIVKWECESLGDDLRCVILTDFIRKEELPKSPDDVKPLYRIGVAPIFEKIRREGPHEVKLGILSGSLVVVPTKSRGNLTRIAREMGLKVDQLSFRPLRHDSTFLSLTIGGARQSEIVGLVTRAFHAGEITVLVGTKSLLGEGWDAPSINALVLASFVGSYMLSNQMRGRAVRIQPGNPEKTANIWHLVCLETGIFGPGDDFLMLSRRFKAFVGVSLREPIIENGVERLDLGGPPFKKHHVKSNNRNMSALAKNRFRLKDDWDEALEGGVQIVHEVEVPVRLMPRDLVFWNTIGVLLYVGFVFGGYLFLHYLDALASFSYGLESNFILFLLLIFIGAAIFILPFVIKAIWLLIRHGPIATSLREIGRALLATLTHIGAIQTPLAQMGVTTRMGEYGEVYCSLKGATSHEKTVFLDALREILDPIENPRYVIARRSRLFGIKREDFHAVPMVIGNRREHAEYFAEMWKKYVGKTELIFTRTVEGRQKLVRARERSMSRAFQKRSERKSAWK